MIGAFFYLTVCSIKNRLRMRFRRLKQPRYLLGSIVGILYFYFFVFGGRSRMSGRPGGVQALGQLITRYSDHVLVIGTGFLFLITALAWLWPSTQTGLAFTRSEVQFLFPAPLTRMQLLNYKLLRTQLAALFGSFFVTIFIRPGSFATNSHFMVGVWLVMSTMSLHLVGVSLTRSSLGRHGRAGISRQRIPLIVAGLLMVAIGSSVMRAWPGLSTAVNVTEVMSQLRSLISTGIGAVVFWPFRSLARVPLAMSTSAFLWALPAAVAVLALNYVWVLRADTAFEEASADAAEKRAISRPGVRRPVVRKNTATPFKLALTGPPETAIVWKNLILIGRYASLKTLLRLLPMMVILSIFLTRSDRRGLTEIIAGLCFIFAAVTVLMGPQMTRNDLRHDLGNLAILKTWPIRGAALLRGEVLAAASILSGLAWLFIFMCALLSGSIHTRGTAAAMILDRVSYAAAALMLAPPLILAQLLIQNAIAVMFPAWITVGRSRAGGVDAIGQRMIMLFGSLLAVGLALFPALVVASAVAGPIYLVTKTVPVVLPAAVTAVVMLAEAWAATEVLGKLLDRTDVASVEATE